MSSSTRFRLLPWLILSLVLFVVAIIVAAHYPSSPLAVTLYKAHMASFAGWIGYWLDRALFPYSRPHECFGDACDIGDDFKAHGAPDPDEAELVIGVGHRDAGLIMLRRAIIVAACLIAVSLGA